MAPYQVKAEWDDEANVWVASSDDVPGLATGADTFEALIDKLKIVIPELLEANCCEASARSMFTVMAIGHLAPSSS
jgi:predicted RNase H-like HicB family nuclease